MTELVSFSAATRLRLLEGFVGSVRPILLKVWPDDGVSELAPEIVLRVGQGRLIGALAAGATGARALARVLLAERGRIEATDDVPPERPPGAYPPFAEVYGHAEQIVAELAPVLEALGGLDAVPVLDPGRARTQLPSLPEEGDVVSRLVDGRRSVGALLASAPFDERLTASILARLYDRGVVGLTRPTATPGQAAEPDTAWAEDEPATIARALGQWSSGPGATEVLGPGEAPFPPPAGAWDLAADAANAPDTQYTIADPKLAAVTQTQPTGRPRPATRPGSTTGSGAPRSGGAEVRAPSTIGGGSIHPGPATSDDDSMIAAAGLGGRSPLLWALALGAVIVVIALLLRSEPAAVEVAVPAPMVVVPPPVPTATVAAVAPAPEPPPTTRRKPRRRRYSLANPPPVAGPDSDARLRRAERLLNQGRLEEADEILSKLRRQIPRDAAVWVLSGMLEDARGNVDAAMRHAKRALKVDAKSYRGWVLKGWLEQSDRALALAIASYRKALSLNPGHAMSPELRTVVRGLEDESG